MDHYTCVASRTRSKHNLHLLILSNGSTSSSSSAASPSSSSEEKMTSGSGKSNRGQSGRKRKGRSLEKRVGEGEPDVVFLGESFCEGEGGSVSCSKRTSEGAGEKMASGSGVSSSVFKGRQRNMSGLKGKKVGEREPDAVLLGECVGESVCEGEGERVSVSCSKGASGGEGQKMVSGSGASSFISEGGGRTRRGLKGKKVVKCEPEFVFLGEDEREWGSFLESKRRREGSFVEPEPVEVIEIDESDGDDDGNEEGLEHCEKKGFEDAADVDEDYQNEDGKGSYVFSDKVENFSNVGCSFGTANPVTIDLDGDSDREKEHGDGNSEEEHGVDESSSGFDSDYLSSSTSSKNDKSSDEDFQVDDEMESSSSEDGSTSYDDDKENEGARFGWRGHRNVSLQKETRDSAKIIESMGKVKQRGNNNESEKNDANDSANDCVNIDAHKGKEHPDEGTSVRSVSALLNHREKIGGSAKILKIIENEKERGNNKERKQNDSNANTNGCVNIDAHKGNEHPDKGTCVTRVPTLLKHQEKIGGAAKIIKRIENEKERGDNKESEKNDANANANDFGNIDAHKGNEDPDKGLGDSAKHKSMEHKKEREATREHKDGDGVNNNNCEKKARVDIDTVHIDGGHKVHRMQSKPKELHLIELLAECFGGKRNSIKDDSNGLEVKDDDVHWRDTPPPACGETLPLKFTWVKAEPVEKTESEKELDMLFEELDRFEEIDCLAGNAGTNEAQQNGGNPATLCKHNFYLDEEIGILCRFCKWIATEIKYIWPPMEDDFPSKGSGKRTTSGEVNVPLFDGDELDVSGGDEEAVSSHNEGTVWDLIPDIRENIYPHQQEGFEFIWTNLAGTIDLQALKSADPSSAGGCIISHAPGTGKTRLTIVFLQTYLEVFPKCRPVVIAPASLLLTWEDEFKKWDIGIPFHNLNNLELSGKEHVAALKKVDWSRNPNQNKDAIRMVKLYSWFKEKSILGISYNLYEKLAGEESKVDVETGKKARNLKKEKKYLSMKKKNFESGVMRKFLRDIPDLLVLDEGHTPRNQRSLIWKVLSEIQTQKRIILSGTPFQNNFLELYNTLCLVKPTFPDRIPLELKKFCQRRLMQERKASKGWGWEPVSSGNTTGNHADEKIHQLKSLMDPFVHVHKGSILQKNLPGLRDCVVTLKPDNLQKALLQSIGSSQNTFIFDHKLALVTVHPSLFLCCSLSEKEESVVDRGQLEELRLNPYGGVKTRFLVEFVRLCEAVNEKVLVFSQFIDPLCLIRDQLKSVFNWSEGKEVLYMYGKLEQKQKQSLIHGFNDTNSKAKILLASTKACSEGINLIGASRVVLLDVVWNPSVERQAISRAYRLGQKRVVYTYHLITQGTTECTKYSKQAEKDRLSELVFSARNAENNERKSSTVVLEDKILDQMVHHEKLKDMFGDCVVQRKDKDLFETFDS